MKNSMFKRFASVLVTFSLALSAFIFIPEKVNAYTQLVLNETVTLSDSDFVHYIGNFAGKGYDAEDDMQYAIVSFTPEETGYYYFDEIGKEWVNFYNIAPWSAEFDVSANRVDSYVNLLQGNRKPAYEMEQGITYYAIFSKSSESPKKLTIRKATEYFRVKPVQKEVAAVKDKTFTCELDLICSNPCTYSVEWTVNNTRQDTTGTKLTLNTNDYFDFAAGVNEGKVDYSLDILCKVYATYNGTTTSLGPYCLFDIIPYNSDFSSSVWAKSVKGNDSHELTYKKDGYSDKFFEVDAGSTDSNCNISYQWYLSTNEVDSNYNTIYTPLVGKTGSKIALKDLGDVNLTYDDLDGLSGTFQNAKCVVTFAKGSQRLTREVTFRVSYHFGISFTCFADDYKNIEDAVSGNIYNPRNITYSVKNGRNVTLPGANSIIESDLPDGLEFTYIWVESNSTYFNFYDFINHQENYNVLGTGKSITVNTTDLQKFNCEEGKASYVVLIAGYKFNGEDIRMQYNVNRTQTFELVYNNLVEPDEAGIAVNETNFPDNNFRSYVAANVDTNQSGYINQAEINAARNLDISNMNISDLTGIEYLTCLKKLDCSWNNIQYIDMNGLRGLLYLNCSNNPLISINLDENPGLKYLYETGSYYRYEIGVTAFGDISCSGAQYTCKTTGLVIEDLTIVENATPSYFNDKQLSIFSNPCDYVGNVGDIAVFSIVADGEEIKYQWQYSQDGNTWRNSNSAGYNTPDMSIKVTEKRNGQQYRCIVKDKYGTEYASAAASIIIGTPLTITTQPQDFSGIVGNKAVFSVEASGEGLKYQWYYSRAGGEWKASNSSGYNTPSMSVKVTEARDGQMYMCKVTDKYGYIAYSDVAVITVVKPQVIINKQPANVIGPVGNYAIFTVEATGEGLTYQWQYSKDGNVWKNSNSTGYNTSSMSIKITDARNGQQYRCIVTDKYGTVAETSAAALYVGQELKITKQPREFIGNIGDTAKFTVTAEGTELTYQWQYLRGDTWRNSSQTGYNTPILKVKVTEARVEQQYKCVITDKFGNVVTSRVVVIGLYDEPSGPSITGQPSSYTGAVGTKATFTVGATGEGLTYQWQYKSPSDSKWHNSTKDGYDTVSMTVKVTEARNGQMYRCVVTDCNGYTVTSDTATIAIG